MRSETPWRIVTNTCSPAMHMALDEVITRRVAEGRSPPTLRFWEWDRPAVVIGAFQSVRDEVFMEMADRHGVEVVRRSTGGGAMFTEPGTVLTYALSLPQEWVESQGIVDSYRELEDWSLTALNELSVEAAHKPINDIVHAPSERKIGGSAQARRNGTVLHHTMMAYDMDIEKMLKVLRIGKEKISDKAIKSAEKRVAPIKTVVDVDRETVKDAMVDAFARNRTVEHGDLTAEEITEAEELVVEKYGTDAWTYRVDREIEQMGE